MWGFFKAARRRRILQKAPLAFEVWNPVWEELKILHRLTEAQEQRLWEMTTVFIREKQFLGVQGLEVTETHRAVVGALACLPVLERGLELLEGWSTIILTPREFPYTRQELDSAGVMHEVEEELGGQVLELGPVVLSWRDVQDSGRGHGFNVVIHEIAHKIDGQHSQIDGCPRLPRGMDPRRWQEVFTRAFYELQDQAERDERGCAIDPYAAEAPEEFFAVVSEYFFELPLTLQGKYPEVYELLREFYRQDPAQG